MNLLISLMYFMFDFRLRLLLALNNVMQFESDPIDLVGKLELEVNKCDRELIEVVASARFLRKKTKNSTESHTRATNIRCTSHHHPPHPSLIKTVLYAHSFIRFYFERMSMCCRNTDDSFEKILNCEREIWSDAFAKAALTTNWEALATTTTTCYIRARARAMALRCQKYLLCSVSVSTACRRCKLNSSSFPASCVACAVQQLQAKIITIFCIHIVCVFVCVIFLSFSAHIYTIFSI